jgi:hypothetical protein
MPMGLKGAPSTQQRFMTSIFSDFQAENSDLDFYVDDLLIGTIECDNLLEVHLAAVRKVLKVLQKHMLRLRWDKCHFARDSVIFLGHLLFNGTRRPIPSKIAALEKWPSPVDKKSLKGWLGFIGYYADYCPKMSKIVGICFDLLKDKVPFLWTENHQKAFKKVNKIFLDEVVLWSVDPRKPFRAFTDACLWAIGGTLEQEHNGTFRPVAFYSAKLSDNQKNWPIRDI